MVGKPVTVIAVYLLFRRLEIILVDIVVLLISAIIRVTTSTVNQMIPVTSYCTVARYFDDNLFEKYSS